MKQVTSDNFETEVLKSSTAVFVEFGADWCAPCKRLEPVLDKLAGENSDRLKVVKVNAEDDQPLALKYQVRGLPTIVVFKNGEPVDRKNGFQSEANLKKLLEAHA